MFGDDVKEEIKDIKAWSEMEDTINQYKDEYGTEYRVKLDQTVSEMLDELLAHHPDGYERFIKNRELDFNYYSPAGVPYRVNAFFKLEKIAVAMRKISYKPLPLEELMYDDVADAVREHVL